MNRRSHQTGMTAIGWLLVMSVGGFFIMLGLKLVPIYLEYNTARKVLRSLPDAPGIERMPLNEVYSTIDKMLDINMVDETHVNRKSHFLIKKVDGTYTITLKYDRREHVMGNVDLIASFEDSVKAPR
ncbi:DUF4845 domain-containing protein [Gammaproteobacteria bacterium]